MKSCGTMIKTWRKKRRYSQLDLALEAGLSSRHLSFIETGRSMPSREMILKINQLLMLPRYVLNSILCAAGHLPQYKCLPQTHEDLKPIYIAIERMLVNQMPYPAIVFDKHWDVVSANEAMKSLLTTLGLQRHKNIIEGLTDPDFNRSTINNYDEVITQLLNRLRSEISFIISDEKLYYLEEKLTNALSIDDTLEVGNTVLNTQFDINGEKINLFSTVADLGAVQDISVGEFKIELMFPLDKKTEDYFLMMRQPPNY